MKLLRYLTLLLIIATCKSVKLPFTLKTCNYKESTFKPCLQLAVENFLKQLKSPLPELDLPSIEPVRFANVTIKNHHAEALSSEEKLENIAFYGLSTAKVSSFDVNFEHYKMSALIEIDALKLDVNMSFNGQAYSEPVHFKGSGIAEFDDTKLNITATFEINEKEGKKYLKIIDVYIFWTYSGGSFPIKSDNAAEAKHWEQLLNKHFKDLFDVVKSDYEAMLVSTFINYGNRVFSKISITELFSWT